MGVFKSWINPLLACALTALIFHVAMGSNAFQDKRMDSQQQPPTTTESHDLLMNGKIPYLGHLMKLREILQLYGIPAFDASIRTVRGSDLPAESNSSQGHVFSARKQRARLDRMPIAFGKRTAVDLLRRSDLRQDGDTMARTNRGRMDRMPLTFGKRETTAAVVKPEEDEEGRRSDDDEEFYDNSAKVYVAQTPEQNIFLDKNDGIFTRQQKSMLNRMPMTFGKRTLDDRAHRCINCHENYGIDDRQSSQFSRAARARLSRMPMTFGRKKKTVEVIDRLMDDVNIAQQNETQRDSYEAWDVFLSLMEKLQLKAVNEHPASLISGDGKEPRVNKGNLDSFPSSSRTDYGHGEKPLLSAADDNVKQGVDEENEMFHMDQRSIMQRMPLAFGKRSFPKDSLKSLQQFNDNHPTFSSRTDYGHGEKPLLSAADGNAKQGVDEENEMFHMDQRSIMQRMPLAFGKRSFPKDSLKSLQQFNDNHPTFSSRTDYGHGEKPLLSAADGNVKQGVDEDNEMFHMDERSIMQRMPLAFGKRSFPKDSLKSLQQFNDKNPTISADSIDRDSGFGYVDRIEKTQQQRLPYDGTSQRSAWDKEELVKGEISKQIALIHAGDHWPQVDDRDDEQEGDNSRPRGDGLGVIGDSTWSKSK